VEDDADKLAGPNGLMRDWGYGLKREWRAFEPNKARFATFIARARLAREQERQRRSILRVLAEGAAATQRGSADGAGQKPTFELKRSRAFADAENEEKKEHSLLDINKEVDGMKFIIKQDDQGEEERKGDPPRRASPSPSPRAAAAASAAKTDDDMHLRIHVGSDSPSDSARLLSAAASPSPVAFASTATSPSKAATAASPSSIRLLTSPQQSSSKLSAASGSSSSSIAVRSPVSVDQFAQMMAKRTNSKPLVFFGQWRRTTTHSWSVAMRGIF
jgi:hypothetical protein